MIRNNQIIIASTVRAINKAKLNGKLDLSNIRLFQLLQYYITFTDKTIENVSDIYLEENKFLKEYIRAFVYNNSDTNSCIS